MKVEIIEVKQIPEGIWVGQIIEVDVRLGTKYGDKTVWTFEIIDHIQKLDKKNSKDSELAAEMKGQRIVQWLDYSRESDKPFVEWAKEALGVDDVSQFDTDDFINKTVFLKIEKIETKAGDTKTIVRAIKRHKTKS